CCSPFPPSPCHVTQLDLLHATPRARAVDVDIKLLRIRIAVAQDRLALAAIRDPGDERSALRQGAEPLQDDTRHHRHWINIPRSMTGPANPPYLLIAATVPR